MAENHWLQQVHCLPVSVDEQDVKIFVAEADSAFFETAVVAEAILGGSRVRVNNQCKK